MSGCTYTHVGYRRETGYIHSARLYGHADYRGRSHALSGSKYIDDGDHYKALCGAVVVADHDGYGCNVQPADSQDGSGVSCRRCRRIIQRGN